jgi:hypothetical protein
MIARVFLFVTADEHSTQSVLRCLDPLGRYFTGVFTWKDRGDIGPSRWRKDFTKRGTDPTQTIIVDGDPV